MAGRFCHGCGKIPGGGGCADCAAERGSSQSVDYQLPTGADGWVAQSPDDETLLSELARVLSTPGEKARILVIEDDVDLARVIGAVFAKDGIDVKLVHTRQAALDACVTLPAAADCAGSLAAGWRWVQRGGLAAAAR